MLADLRSRHRVCVCVCVCATHTHQGTELTQIHSGRKAAKGFNRPTPCQAVLLCSVFSFRPPVGACFFLRKREKKRSRLAASRRGGREVHCRETGVSDLSAFSFQAAAVRGRQHVDDGWRDGHVPHFEGHAKAAGAHCPLCFAHSGGTAVATGKVEDAPL